MRYKPKKQIKEKFYSLVNPLYLRSVLLLPWYYYTTTTHTVVVILIKNRRGVKEWWVVWNNVCVAGWCFLLFALTIWRDVLHRIMVCFWEWVLREWETVWRSCSVWVEWGKESKHRLFCLDLHFVHTLFPLSSLCVYASTVSKITPPLTYTHQSSHSQTTYTFLSLCLTKNHKTLSLL